MAPRPRNTARRIAVTGLVILAGFSLACTAGSKDSATSPVSDKSSAVAKAPAGAKLGTAVRDGKFEFTVTKVTCGIKQVGSGVVSKKAQGQYCKIAVTVSNIGSEAQMFASSSQYAYNAAGVKYDADGAAEIYLADAGAAFLNNINPGNRVAGTLVFDIPVGQKLASLELHDSPFSDGVTVNLTA